MAIIQARRGRSTRLIIIGVALAVFVIGGGTWLVTRPRDPVSLVESSLTIGQSGARILIGTFRNNTDRSFALVQVNVVMLRQDSSLFDSVQVRVNDLAPGQRWRFKVPIIGPDAQRFVLTRITCRPTMADSIVPAGEKPPCALNRPVEVK